jgi:nucleoside diphosphate kinase
VNIFEKVYLKGLAIVAMAMAIVELSKKNLKNFYQPGIS